MAAFILRGLLKNISRIKMVRGVFGYRFSYGNRYDFEIDGSDVVLYVKEPTFFQECIRTARIYDENDVIITQLDGVINKVLLIQAGKKVERKDDYIAIPIMFPPCHYKGTCEIEFDYHPILGNMGSSRSVEYSYENKGYPEPPFKLTEFPPLKSYDIGVHCYIHTPTDRISHSPVCISNQKRDYVIIHCKSQIEKIHLSERDITLQTIYCRDQLSLFLSYAGCAPIQDYYIFPLKSYGGDYSLIFEFEKEYSKVVVYYF